MVSPQKPRKNDYNRRECDGSGPLFFYNVIRIREQRKKTTKKAKKKKRNSAKEAVQKYTIRCSLYQ